MVKKSQAGTAGGCAQKGLASSVMKTMVLVKGKSSRYKRNRKMGVQKVEACDLKDFKKSCCCAVLIQVWLFDFPDKSTGVSCHFLLQGIFPIQGLNLHFLHCRQILYHWGTGKALKNHAKLKFSQKFRNIFSITCNFPVTLDFKETFTL